MHTNDVVDPALLQALQQREDAEYDNIRHKPGYAELIAACLSARLSEKSTRLIVLDQPACWSGPLSPNHIDNTVWRLTDVSKFSMREIDNLLKPKWSSLTLARLLREILSLRGRSASQRDIAIVCSQLVGNPRISAETLAEILGAMDSTAESAPESTLPAP